MKTKTLIFTITLLASTTLIKGQKLQDWFVDTTDNALDVSNFLATRAGFLPVPTFITEPAVGYGFGFGMLFFHRTKEEKETGDFLPLPKGISAVGGMATENGSWASLVGHMGSWKNDRIRYLGLAGYIDVNLTYYKHLEFFGRELSVDFNISGIPFYQEFMFRVEKSNWFVGGQYLFFSNEVSLSWDTPIFPEGIKRSIRTGGLGAQVVFDTRDNIFTTNKGVRTEFNIMHFAPYFGSDRYYNTYMIKNVGFVQLGTKVNAGTKVEADLSSGDIPFYAQPSIRLRGIPAMRYQNDLAAVADFEVRYGFYSRWSLIGFVGIGAAVPYEQWQNNINLHTSVGGGFRYFLARIYNIHAGIDVAKGPEEWAWYITVGTYWMR
jgi:hypothetical protein